MMATIGKSLLAIVVTIALVVGLVIGGWALYQWNISKKYQADTHNQQYQSALIAQERDRAEAWDKAVDTAQKSHLASTFCAVYVDITDVPTDLVLANERICH